MGSQGGSALANLNAFELFQALLTYCTTVRVEQGGTVRPWMLTRKFFKPLIYSRQDCVYSSTNLLIGVLMLLNGYESNFYQ
jgi:hypothetical protein